MNSQLLRQINPQFVQAGKVSSQAFRPMNNPPHLSTYNGDLISAEDAYIHYTNDLQNESFGVMAITTGECSNCKLQIIEDKNPFPEHISIDFSGLSINNTKKASQQLRNDAEKRGWLFRT